LVRAFARHDSLNRRDVARAIAHDSLARQSSPDVATSRELLSNKAETRGKLHLPRVSYATPEPGIAPL
jgi:hypothetical protein